MSGGAFKVWQETPEYLVAAHTIRRYVLQPSDEVTTHFPCGRLHYSEMV